MPLGFACARHLAWLPFLGASLAAEPVALEQVAEGLYVHVGAHEEAGPGNLGAIGNGAVVIGDEAVAIIDTGGSLAYGERLRARVHALTDLPVHYVVNTHVHPDHVLGNAAFADGTVQFVGHHKLARAFATRAPYYLAAYARLLGPDFEGTRVVMPTVAVHDELRIDLGNRPLLLRAYPTAHTDNDLTVLDLRTSTLLAGDLVFMERLPVVDGSLQGWLRAMSVLREIEAQRVVPGHGPASAAWPGALDAQQRYLEALVAGVREEIGRGGTIETAVRRVGRDQRAGWLLFDDIHPRNVTASFTELEWE